MKFYNAGFFFSIVMMSHHCAASLNKEAMVNFAGHVGLAIGIHASFKVWEWAVVGRKEGPSEIVQNHARKILHDAQADNADSIMFKSDSCWTSYGGGYIGIKKEDDEAMVGILKKSPEQLTMEDRDKQADMKFSVLHENKHVQNHDSFKVVLTGMLCKYIVDQTSPLHSLEAAGFCVGLFLGYKKYQEHTADEYAYTKMLPSEAGTVQKYWQKLATKDKEIFEKEYSVAKSINVLLARILSFFSYKIFGGIQSDHQERIFFKIHSFFRYIQHPDNLHRAELAKKYADQKCV